MPKWQQKNYVYKSSIKNIPYLAQYEYFHFVYMEKIGRNLQLSQNIYYRAYKGFSQTLHKTTTTPMHKCLL